MKKSFHKKKRFNANARPDMVTLHPPLTRDSLQPEPTPRANTTKKIAVWVLAVLFFYISLPILLFRYTKGKYNLVTRTAISIMLGFVLLSVSSTLSESELETAPQTTTATVTAQDSTSTPPDDTDALDIIAPTPTCEPTTSPTAEPTIAPTVAPTAAPTAEPTTEPTVAPTQIPTLAPTISPTESPTAVPVVEAVIESAPAQTTEQLVWIPTKGGTKYHIKSTCSGMDGPIQVTISEAIALGFTPCGHCY